MIKDATRPNLIQSEWKNFENQVLPLEFPDDERQLIHGAFFAGAYAMYVSITRELPALLKEDCLAWMAEIDEETKIFLQKSNEDF